MAYKVLICEDQVITQELFKIYIDSSEKFEHILSISNASLALDVCKNNKVDLILMDVMTELHHSGLDAAKEIKQQFPDIPDTMMNDPNQVLQYLQQTRNISNDQLAMLMNQFPRF